LSDAVVAMVTGGIAFTALTLLKPGAPGIQTPQPALSGESV
jgi:hypothetical protein